MVKYSCIHFTTFESVAIKSNLFAKRQPELNIVGKSYKLKLHMPRLTDPLQFLYSFTPSSIFLSQSDFLTHIPWEVFFFKSEKNSNC